MPSLFQSSLNAGFAALALSTALPAQAQVSLLPAEVQQVLATVGPKWGSDIGKNIDTTAAAFDPLMAAAPKDGVTATKNVNYGEDARQVLDVFAKPGISNAPIVIFVHGGAYVRGDRDVYGGAYYGNVATYFARQGMVGVNATYRLAPGAKWPSGAEDVRGMVKWAKENAAKYGGDASKVYVIGHSAGATHLASYIFDKSLQPKEGAGIAGAILMSGRYSVDFNPADPNGKNMQAYFGEDASAYANRSPINHIKDGEKVPVFVVIAEYENPGLDIRGAELLAALCACDGACPRFKRMEKHNHLSEVFAFNSPDDQLGREITDFMTRGK